MDCIFLSLWRRRVLAGGHPGGWGGLDQRGRSLLVPQLIWMNGELVNQSSRL
ncbi:hypothetical protein GGTG_10170 [Gaeumannomyces tritici R3-111a-1]|uniref:Uncharacterized protein n=1 Tax=Gaeumannomyces tritici (strain R3-111a-1) TaxID=644352 RepID=J3P9J0_GAET3|nr:hypothetical protein GGTG_10170 [Gaeumannomyces tritici R3-111a-1]EJT73326.1 hypothetical protein GGTG_10170 [Gaeumannomyces tritici R3-111a-1]